MNAFLAPLYKGKVRLRGQGGLIQELKAEGPPGWSWWTPLLPGKAAWECLATLQELEPHLGKLQDAQTVEPGKVRFGLLRLGEHLPAGMWVKIWLDAGLPWFVRPGARPGCRPPKLSRDWVEQAVLKGRGRLLGWEKPWVEWASSDGARYRTRIDDSLNVVEAGFCMNGTDRVHDLTSLVSLSAERAGYYREGYGWS